MDGQHFSFPDEYTCIRERCKVREAGLRAFLFEKCRLDARLLRRLIDYAAAARTFVADREAKRAT